MKRSLVISVRNFPKLVLSILFLIMLINTSIYAAGERIQIAPETSVIVGEEVLFDASEFIDLYGHNGWYEWDFGDGYKLQGDDSGVSVTHCFMTPGKYNVRLDVTAVFNNDPEFIELDPALNDLQDKYKVAPIWPKHNYSFSVGPFTDNAISTGVVSRIIITLNNLSGTYSEQIFDRNSSEDPINKYNSFTLNGGELSDDDYILITEIYDNVGIRTGYIKQAFSKESFPARDNIEMTVRGETPMEGYELLHADFHGRIAQYLYLKIPKNLDIASAQVRLIHQDTNTIISLMDKDVDCDSEEKIYLETSALDKGTYLLEAEIFDENRNSLSIIRERFEKQLEKDVIPHVAIDENNSVCLDGDPYFVFTPWILNASNLDYYSRTITAAHGIGYKKEYNADSWPEYLDSCEEEGLLGIGPNKMSRYSGLPYDGAILRHLIRNSDLRTIADIVTAAKDHPAQLMWAYHDEPNLGGRASMGLPQSVRSWTYKSHQLDPQHLVTVNLAGADFADPTHMDWSWHKKNVSLFSYYKVDNYEDNKEAFGGKRVPVADIIGFDIYPVGWQANELDEDKISFLKDPNKGVIEMYAEAIDNIQKYNYGLLPAMSWVEVCDNSYDAVSHLTPEQIRMEAWLNIVHGIKGIWWFHYHTEVKAAAFGVMAETKDIMNDLENIVLGASTPFAVSDNANTRGNRVDTLIREDNDYLYLFAVRVTEPEPEWDEVFEEQFINVDFTIEGDNFPTVTYAQDLMKGYKRVDQIKELEEPATHVELTLSETPIKVDTIYLDGTSVDIEPDPSNDRIWGLDDAEGKIISGLGNNGSIDGSIDYQDGTVVLEFSRPVLNVSISYQPRSSTEKKILINEGKFSDTFERDEVKIYKIPKAVLEDNQAPSVPTGITGTAHYSRRIDLSWEAASDDFGVKGYKIYENNVEIADVMETQYSHTGLNPVTRYTYTIKSYDYSDNYSNSSTAVEVTTLDVDTNPPSKPEIISVSPISFREVCIKWNPAEDDREVIAYRVYRDGTEIAYVSNDTNYNDIFTYNDDTVTYSSSYEYRISALDEDNETFSDPVTVMTPEGEYHSLTINPAQGGIVTVEPEQNEYLKWTDVRLQAIPDSGFKFIYWQGIEEGYSNPITINMDEDMIITPYFASESPVLYMKFDGNLIDTAGLNSEGSWQGNSSYTEGVSGQALLLTNEENNYITLESNDLLEGMSGITISFWAKKNDPEAASFIVHNHTTYLMRISSTGISGYLFNDNGEQHSFSEILQNHDTEWHHYALTYDGEDISIYFDGFAVNSLKMNGLIASNNRGINIGKSPWENYNFDGLLDELRIYDRALIPQEISKLYTSAGDESYAPTISRQPESQTVSIGENIRFSVIAEGNPAPDYQWQKNGQDLPGETKAQLQLSDIEGGDAGEYRVIVSNSMGSVRSETAVLAVIDSTLPGVTAAKETVEYYNVYLSWINPAGQGENWDRISVIRKKIDANEGFSEELEIYNDTGNSLLDRDLNKGTYSYYISTYKDTGTSRVYSEAEVIEGISIPEFYNKKYLKIEIDPEVSSERKIRIGQNTEGDLYSLWNEEKITIGRGPTGKESSLWLYSDIIGNDEDQVPLDSKIVSARLVFNVEGRNIDNLNIDNQAHTISIYQIKDTDNLGIPFFAEESGIRVGLDYKYRDHRPGVNKPWLPEDGIDDSSIIDLFAGIEPLDEVEFCPVVYQDGLVKTMEFDITEAVQAWAGRALEQGLFITTNKGWNDGENMVLSGINSEEKIDRPYIEIIYVPNYSSSDIIAPEKIKNISIEPYSDRINLTWDNPTDSDFAGVKLIRREGIIPFNSRDEAIIAYVDRNEQNNNSYTDSGLSPGKIYYYALYAYDEEHNYSEKAWIKGIPGSPAAVQGLSAADHGSGTVYLSWTSIEGVSSYNIYRKNELAEEGGIEDIHLIANIKDDQIQFHDYVLAGEYTYWVSALNDLGEGPLSEGETISISEDSTEKPTAPTEFNGTGISGSKIHLYWIDSNDETGYPTGYHIERKEADDSWENGVVIAELDFDVNTYIDSGLLPDTEYMYRIKTVNMVGESDYVTTALIRTSDEPVAVKNISWEVISASQIKIEWEDTANEDAYKVELFGLTEDGEIDEEALDTQNLSANISYCYFVRLEPEEEYRVRVTSVKGNEFVSIESDIIRTSADPKGGLF